MNLETFMMKHDQIVLQFSAGKDSAACLKMLRPYIDRVILVWVNPGDPYNETLEYMRNIQDSVPHFAIANGDQRGYIRAHGHPADSVPFDGTLLGRATSGNTIRIIPVQNCCAANLWSPLHSATQRMPGTGVVRGEKRCDPHKSVVGEHAMYDGKEYFNPLYSWSDEEVFKFIGDDLPPSYKRGLRSSLDCRTCTAHLAHSSGRLADLEHSEPQAYAEIKPIISWLTEQARANLANLERL